MMRKGNKWHRKKIFSHEEKIQKPPFFTPTTPPYVPRIFPHPWFTCLKMTSADFWENSHLAKILHFHFKTVVYFYSLLKRWRNDQNCSKKSIFSMFFSKRLISLFFKIVHEVMELRVFELLWKIDSLIFARNDLKLSAMVFLRMPHYGGVHDIRPGNLKNNLTN